MSTNEITPKDRQLLAVLRENARISMTDLAVRLNQSRSTVQTRLKRLEDIGVIEGYGVRIAPGYAAREINCHVLITHAPRMVNQIVARLSDIESVRAVHSVSGSVDLVAEVATESIDAMDLAIDSIGAIEGVEKTNSHLILSTRLSRASL